MYKTCTIDGKALKRLYINGRLVYCTDPDQMVIANTLAMSGDFGSKVSLGTNSYVWNGSTYNYTVYDMPVAPKWAPIGAGNDNPWHISPNVVVCAAHWASSLKTGTWTGSGGLTYNVSEWTNLRTWALANGYTEEQLAGMMDIGDIVVAVCGNGSTSFNQNECPWLIASDLVKTAFWNGSLKGTIGYHVPQKSIEQSGGDGWACYPSTYYDGVANIYIKAVQESNVLKFYYANESDPTRWTQMVYAGEEPSPVEFTLTQDQQTVVLHDTEVSLGGTSWYLGDGSYLAAVKGPAWSVTPSTITMMPQFADGYILFDGWAPYEGTAAAGATKGDIDSMQLSWTSGVDASMDVTASRSSGGGDMKLVAPVVMRSSYSWGIPKDSYIDIPERDSTTRNCASSYENTYLGYVGDSGKPTYVQIDQYQVVVGQCHSQFAGPDICACLPVLKAFVEANGDNVNVLTENLLPT